MRFCALFLLLCALPASATEPVDLDVVNRIRHEGFENSQVMDIAWHLTEVIGARVTGSPAMMRASEWTRDTMTGWGMANGNLEPFAFGRGWDWQRCRVDLLGEAPKSLSAIPQAWTPGTDGPVRGEVVLLAAEEPEDLEEYAGQLEGKIVLLGGVESVEPRDEAPFSRRTPEQLAELDDFDIPGERSSRWRDFITKYTRFRRALDEFLVEEGGLAVLDHSSRAHGILRVPRGAQPDDPERKQIPVVTLMTEQYNRLVRLVEDERRVEVEVEVEASFHGDHESEAFNTFAEIPGAKKRDEIVMLGAHLDSYHAGTGATDNAAGCAVMMEAARILMALGERPARTIRVALWAGEEQGLLGSEAWVREHVASRPAVADTTEIGKFRSLRQYEGELTEGPLYDRISVYLNVDNGGGRIRGIYTEGNVAVVPIFEGLFAPLADLGVSTVTTNATSGTDHMPFDQAGIPAFQFVQDRMDYMPQTHHSHVDTYDHLLREDLMQAAVVVATVAWHAANREDPFPRRPPDAE